MFLSYNIAKLNYIRKLIIIFSNNHNYKSNDLIIQIEGYVFKWYREITFIYIWINFTSLYHLDFLSYNILQLNYNRKSIIIKTTNWFTKLFLYGIEIIFLNIKYIYMVNFLWYRYSIFNLCFYLIILKY